MSDRFGTAAVPIGVKRWGTRRAQQATQATETVPKSPFEGMQWSLAYAAMLFYVVIIITYRFSIGSIVISIALAGLIFERRPRVPAMILWLGLLFVWTLLGMTTSNWPNWVYDRVTDFGKVWLIALVVVATLTDRKRIRLFMLVSVAAYALYPARGALFNYFVSGYTLNGRALWNHIYANPNDLGVLTLLQLSVAAAVLVSEPRGLYRWGAIAAVIVLPVLILLTQSRAVFIALGVVGVLVLTAQRRKARTAGMLAVVLLAAALFVPTSAWERMGMVRTIGEGGTAVLADLDDDGSAEQRYEIWQNSFRIMRDHPLYGVGWGAYPFANLQYNRSLGAKDTHSTYFNVAAEAGFPGITLFAILIVSTFMRSRQARRAVAATDPAAAQQLWYLELGLIGFLVAGVFGSYAKLTVLYLHIGLIWSLAGVHLRAVQAARRHAVHARLRR